MDVVYILGEGSKWDNNEIRYSIRSLERHLKGLHHIFIIGRCPEFLKHVHHIPAEDTHKYKQPNILKKVMLACSEPDITENFLFMNDDHFLNAEFDIKTFPFYYKNLLEDNIRDREWDDTFRRSMVNTLVNLQNQRITPIYNYDTHTPIIYNKTGLRRMMQYVDPTLPDGYSIKSLYGNMMVVDGVHEVDCKLGRTCNYQTAMKKIKEAKIFSTSDTVGKDVREVIQMLYPDKSTFEK